MSHVDEGALHAYLDGALEEYPTQEARQIRDHLEACAQCAIKLEAERRVRQDASEILGFAVPNVEAPSFEELRAYVKATRPATSPTALRLYRLGWAASIMLALGVGWVVRDGQLQVPAASSSESMVVAPVPDGEGSRAAVGAAPDELAEQVLLEDAQREAEDVGARDVLVTDSSASDLGRQEAGQVSARQSSAREDDEKTTTPEAEELAAGLEMPRVSAERVGGGDVPDQDEAFARTQEELVADVSGIIDSAGRTNELGRTPGAAVEGAAIAGLPLEQQRVPVDSIGVDLRAQAPAPPPVEAAEAQEARRRAESTEPAQARIDVAANAGPVVRTFDDAPAVPDSEAPLVVPGLEVISYANVAEGTTPSGVHILQRLDDGQILDVYHLPEGVDPSVLPPVEVGRNEVRAERDGRWVILRAVLDTDALNELLARLDPEG